MPSYQGFGDRVRERLRVLGYWKGDKPDVARFARDHDYVVATVYAWLRGTPAEKHLERLARDLHTTPVFLTHGIDKAGGPPVRSGRVEQLARHISDRFAPVFDRLADDDAERYYQHLVAQVSLLADAPFFVLKSDGEKREEVGRGQRPRPAREPTTRHG